MHLPLREVRNGEGQGFFWLVCGLIRVVRSEREFVRKTHPAESIGQNLMDVTTTADKLGDIQYLRVCHELCRTL